jgi:hypothetical protein
MEKRKILTKREKNVVLFTKGGRSAKVIQLENPQNLQTKKMCYIARTFPKCDTSRICGSKPFFVICDCGMSPRICGLKKNRILRR